MKVSINTSKKAVPANAKYFIIDSSNKLHSTSVSINSFALKISIGFNNFVDFVI